MAELEITYEKGIQEIRAKELEARVVLMKRRVIVSEEVGVEDRRSERLETWRAESSNSRLPSTSVRSSF